MLVNLASAIQSVQDQHFSCDPFENLGRLRFEVQKRLCLTHIAVGHGRRMNQFGPGLHLDPSPSLDSVWKEVGLLLFTSPSLGRPWEMCVLTPNAGKPGTAKGVVASQVPLLPK